MKIDSNSIRVGNIIEYNGKLWVVAKTMHTQPGKGGAYVQVEMKDIDGKIKNNVRFRSSEFVEKVHLETYDFQYLYIDGDSIWIMSIESYEQINIPISMVGEQLPFLIDGLILAVDFYQGKPVVVRLPDTIIAEIRECEPVVKGQTATSSYKPAVLDNGVRVMVPQFLNQGDKVVIKTESREYVERA
ncbi:MULTISPECIES: elongation factor P [unclassified Candidatus Lariskella]|uniref:elongation factor P n=1 Tax=unclassified Candidatus Lariskella TaxID=2632605 RepID=UPI0030D390C9